MAQRYQIRHCTLPYIFREYYLIQTGVKILWPTYNHALLSRRGQHRLPGTVIATDTQPVARANQRQAQQLGLSLNPAQEFGIREFQILQAPVNIRLPFAIEYF